MTSPPTPAASPPTGAPPAAASPAAQPPDLDDLTRELVGTPGSWGPTLDPEGGRVAFVSDRGGQPELWVAGLEKPAAARRLALSVDPVLAVDWSPDGAWLACSVATGGGVRTEVWVVRPDGTGARRIAGGDADRPGAAETNPALATGATGAAGGGHAKLGPWLRHGHRLVVGRPATARTGGRAVVVDPGTGAEELLAEGGLLDVLDVSADERLAILRDGPRGAQRCTVLDRTTATARPLLPHPGTGSTPRATLRPAPPGHGPAAVIAYLITDAGRPRAELVGVPLDGAGRRRGAGVLAARADADLEWLDADDDGTTVVLGWNAGGCSEVELLDTASGQRRPVTGLPGSVVSGAVTSRSGGRTVLAVEGPDQPPSLVVLDHRTGTAQPVPGAGSPPWRGAVMPSAERFESHDGLPLTGWLYRPPGGPGPALLSFHGGPEAQERPVWNPQHQVLAAAGITVLAPNIRGSSGFGRAFVHADDRSGRREAIADVDACADFLVRRGIAAPGRIAVSGRSYGGYLTLAALVSFPDVFAAGVDICGMSDLRTFFDDTEPWIAAAAVSKYGDPAEDRDLLEELSPLPRADRIRAPVLVVHGELDTNVPVTESHRIVGALRRLGRPVGYLELAGEGHDYRRTSSRLALLEAMVAFLRGALGLGPVERPGGRRGPR